MPDTCALSVEGTTPGGKGKGEGSDEDDDVQRGQASLTAEQGLKHLLLTVDVERLYRQVSASCLLTILTVLPILTQACHTGVHLKAATKCMIPC